MPAVMSAERERERVLVTKITRNEEIMTKVTAKEDKKYNKWRKRRRKEVNTNEKEGVRF